MHDQKQIFCFTYAGGNTAFFDEIENDLVDFDVVKLEYPGHGTRHKEPFCQSFAELADDLYKTVKKEYTGNEYALFGYSMGTISAIEVLRRIIDRNEIPAPDHVFLAAHEPQTKAELVGFAQDELDEWVKERTIRFGGVPEKLINNRSFWRMYLPIYRADYSIIGKYEFEKLDLVSGIPATVFYSETDTHYQDMVLWKKIFVGDCRFYPFEGQHFFIRQYHTEMAEIIRNRINRRA